MKTQKFRAGGTCPVSKSNSAKGTGFNLPKLSAVTPARGPSSLSTTVFFTLPSFSAGGHAVSVLKNCILQIVLQLQS